MRALTKEEVRASAFELSTEEQGELVDDLILNLAESEIPAWQRDLLDERLANDEANPSAGSSWEDVEARIRATL
jgi:putative addiction module component (TIGR02574 family)